MEGVTIIETRAIEKLTQRIENMEVVFKQTVAKLEEATKPWMNSKEVADYLDKGSTWVDLNKHVIGCSKAGGEWRFRRKDVEAYLESSYYKK